RRSVSVLPPTGGWRRRPARRLSTSRWPACARQSWWPAPNSPAGCWAATLTRSSPPSSPASANRFAGQKTPEGVGCRREGVLGGDPLGGGGQRGAAGFIVQQVADLGRQRFRRHVDRHLDDGVVGQVAETADGGDDGRHTTGQTVADRPRH